MVMDYPVSFLSCRTDGHAWEPKQLIIVGTNMLERHLWCGKHGGWRIDRVDTSSGEVAHRKYVTPKEFHVRGQGRVRSTVFRKLLADREWNHAKMEGKAS